MKMLMFCVTLLLFALALQQAESAILISPGLDKQNDPSIAKFHLVANNDVTIRVSSKGLVLEPSALRSCFAPIQIPSVTRALLLSVANSLAAPTALIKKCGHCKSPMSSTPLLMTSKANAWRRVRPRVRQVFNGALLRDAVFDESRAAS
jgi:hypothetical protein